MQTCAELAALIDATNAELQATIAERNLLNDEISALEVTLMSLWMVFWMQCSGGGAAATAPPPDSDLSRRAKELVERLKKLGAIK